MILLSKSNILSIPGLLEFNTINKTAGIYNVENLISVSSKTVHLLFRFNKKSVSQFATNKYYV